MVEHSTGDTVAGLADSTADNPVKTGVRVSWPHVVLGLIGLALSAYTLHLHYIVKSGGDSGCGFSNTISCDKVLRNYGELLHIPWGAYGIVYFLIVLVTAITTQPPGADRSVAGSRLAVAGAGFLVSIGLTAFSITVIHAACPFCLATHTTTLLIFLVSLWGYLRARR